MLIINETDKLNNNRDSISTSNSGSRDDSCEYLSEKSIVTKLEKRIRKHRSPYRNGKTSIDMGSPDFIAPLLSTNATLLSVLPSLPPPVDEAVLLKDLKLMEKNKRNGCCLIQDSPFYIHKVNSMLFSNNEQLGKIIFLLTVP